MQKYVPLVEQNVMKLEVFILGGQRVDQMRKKEWWRGRRERIEKGSKDRIEIERKQTKGNRVNNMKRRIRNIDTTCCSASSRHCISPEFPTRFCSKALQQ